MHRLIQINNRIISYKAEEEELKDALDSTKNIENMHELRVFRIYLQNRLTKCQKALDIEKTEATSTFNDIFKEKRT